MMKAGFLSSIKRNGCTGVGHLLMPLAIQQVVSVVHFKIFVVLSFLRSGECVQPGEKVSCFVLPSCYIP